MQDGPGRGGQPASHDVDEIGALMTLVRGHMDQGKLSAARWAVTHPVQARSLVRWLRGLPRTMVAPSDDRAGAVLRKRFAGM